MKVIISHDVDHITACEHYKDLIIPKFIVRGLIELGLGNISMLELKDRIESIIQNKWENIEELMRFDKANGIPSTFFIAVKNGRKLNYSLRSAEIWMKRIIQKGFDAGVHGIAFDNYTAMKMEFDSFKELSMLDMFGIRVHDIGVKTRDAKLTSEDLTALNKIGYHFSSNTFELKNPFKVGNLWEFPIHIMDGYVMQKNSGFQNQTLEQAKITTKELMNKACASGVRYFSILFHDFFFSDGFRTWNQWYQWLAGHCNKKGIEFINYRKAIQELSDNKE